MAQSETQVLDVLDKAGLVSVHEKKTMLERFKTREEHLKKMKLQPEPDTSTKRLPFYILRVLMQAKMFSTAGTLNAMFFRPAEIKIQKGKETEYIERLSAFAEKIKKAHLISPATFEEAVQQIRSLELRSEYEVSEFVTQRSETEYYLQPSKYKKFADTLLSRGIITQENYTIVMSKLANSEFRNYYEIYPYLKNFVSIDLSQLPSDPLKQIEAVHQQTSTVLPQLAYDSFKLQIVENKGESSTGFKFYDVKVTLTQNGKNYSHKSFYDLEPRRQPNPSPYVIDIQQYHQVFNKMLVDKGSEQRLHIVRMGAHRFGVLPLTRTQFTGLMWSYDGMSSQGYISLSYENFSPKITRKKLADALAFYDSIGLLAGYTTAQKDSCVEDLQAGEINYYSDVLSGFPDMIFEIDLEYGVASGQYKALTQQLASISHGHFKPTNIIDTYDWKKARRFSFGFTLNGRHFSTTLEQKDDWLDPGFIELIEKAVAATDNTGRFYLVYPNDGVRYIYLTNEQYQALKAKKLLELEPLDE